MSTIVLLRVLLKILFYTSILSIDVTLYDKYSFPIPSTIIIIQITISYWKKL